MVLTVFDSIVLPQIPLPDTTLDAAKSSIVYSVTKGVSTSSRAVRILVDKLTSGIANDKFYNQATASFVNQALKNVNQNHNTELLKKFKAVTKEEVLSALEKSFLPLFDPQSSVAVIVTAPNKSETIAGDMTALGFEVEQRKLDVGVADGLDLEGGDSSGSEDGSEDSKQL